MTSPTTQARYPVTPHPFISPTSFYNVGIGEEVLRFRPEWAVLFKERDMGHTETPWLYDEGEGEIYVRINPLTKYIIADLECNAEGNGPYIVECVNSHASLVEEVERLREALTPSGETKAAYMGEFTFKVVVGDDDGEDIHEYYTVPWTTIKEIMAAIRERANAQI